MNRVALVLSALLLAGCAAATAPTPARSSSPKAPGAATKPATSDEKTAPAPAQNATAPAQNAPTVGGINPKLSAIYVVGRVWEYESTLASPLGPLKTTMRQEVVAVADGKATLKMRVGVLGNNTDTTTTVDLGQSDVRAALVSGAGPSDGAQASDAKWTEKSVSSEQLTVKAGTFQTTKYMGTAQDKTSSVDSTFWVADEVGLVKSISKGQASVSGYTLLQLPEGFTMPTGISFPTDGTATSTATPASMDVETVTELISFKR